MLEKNKHRYIKTFFDKYGINSVYTEVNSFLKEGNLEEFRNIPCLGNFYIPEQYYRELVFEREKTDVEGMYLAKVIEVDESFVTYAQYDDHTNKIILTKIKNDVWALKGNVIQKK